LNRQDAKIAKKNTTENYGLRLAKGKEIFHYHDLLMTGGVAGRDRLVTSVLFSLSGSLGGLAVEEGVGWRH
jgi:hypothetical protein